MLISPKYERQIDWSFSYINQPINSQWATIVSADRQKVTLLDRNFSPKYEYQLPDEISCLAITPKGDRLAAIMANGNHLAILTAKNQLLYEQQLPNPPVKYSHLHNKNGFQDCWFDADGLRFWCMKLIEGEAVEIQIRDTNSWQIQRQLLLKDPFGGSSFSFHPHPENQILALWAAAGQHGQQVYWLYDDGIKIHAVEVACLADTTPPEFHPGASEFLVLDNTGSKLSRFSFPDCNLLGICECPCPDSDDWFRYSMCYLSDDRVLIDTDRSRMYIIDIDKMETSDELILIGHEPRLSQEVYPDINDIEEGLFGDLDCFYHFDSDSILSVHSQVLRQEPRSKQKTLVIFGGEELFGSLAKVQPSAPYSKLFIQSLGIS
ncbi:MAG: hypothetical protein JGK38_28735 [Microcoleus sp. PH2017_15_JOR_U_A]|uniref:hypothetical protein n=1 Tax=unclassified Microcoleus TaxID=2642155 RepID=UPI001D735B11|nr:MULTISPECIES: hypothetical protein [unclassified Microcoleus]TAG50598.1 MAG: hypothetical protein EAZ28_32475 [Oscillatoriales cyanobacterium]MCC3447635.1 hypothetical protein [Microcoleus sp. PH2017_09_SFU_O_A]MCC3500519.1 hypothetical protein [Microcoleus sp. PH2017_15_JOR_U_A]MCC3569268.1 hypothetical protein [Microcoleus sp. PH2017_31_RDM_U_A]MCC3581604.1 hypothetical protein [Microcoleus sp. PH2017_32_RDM_D_A]